MDIEIKTWLQTIEAGIGLVPSAIIAAVLLGGPTAGWLLYRFVVQPRTSRYRAVDGGAIMWVCASCRSVNELRADRCYRCDRMPDEADLHVIDPNLGMPIPMNLPLPTAMTGMPVGPGRSDLASLPGLTGLTGIRGVTANETRPTDQADRKHVAVGPGRPRAARPRRAIVVGRPRALATDPDDPSAA